MATKKLRPRQERILEFIREYLDEYDYPPTIREIGAAAKISSTSVVNYNLERLESMGLIERNREVSRGLRLVGYGGDRKHARCLFSAISLPVILSLCRKIRHLLWRMSMSPWVFFPAATHSPSKSRDIP